MSGISRRDALSLLAGAAVGAPATATTGGTAKRPETAPVPRRFRVRTLTAGTPLTDLGDTRSVAAALDFLVAAKQRVVAAGYEVQTIRVALNPLLLDAGSAARAAALPKIGVLDSLAAERGAVLNIGPVFARAPADAKVGPWAADLARATRATSFSVSVASPAHGVHRDALQVAARVIAELAGAAAGGVANFRFAAAANIPAGTPFFPVGYHEGPASLAVGLESANLVTDAFAAADASTQPVERLRMLLNEQLAPVERLARAVASAGERRYLGIDASPAPGVDSSIGHAIEVLTGQKFGAASTLQACAAITAAVKSLDVATCGYSGLMLPILEDPVLAARAAEGRVSLSELLLYSSVCGTGLDVVPVPGDAHPDELARVLGDVATLAARLGKPLSARLFPMPGKKAGDAIEFSDPLLCASKVLPLGP